MHRQAGNGVFDMSQFTAPGAHPGGAGAITRNCGQQVTNWADKSGGHKDFVYVFYGASE